MTHRSDPALRVLHAVRTLGYTDTARLANRLDLPESTATEHLLDAQSHGWVAWSSFGDEGGWSLTERGKAYGEQLLAAELDATGARPAVEDTYDTFLVVNEPVARSCTNWQLSEMGIEPTAASLDATLASLGDAARELEAIEARLTTYLDRYDGYHARFDLALARATTDPRWITGTDRDSAHRVWFELHEDLIATLGLSR